MNNYYLFVFSGAIDESMSVCSFVRQQQLSLRNRFLVFYKCDSFQVSKRKDICNATQKCNSKEDICFPEIGADRSKNDPFVFRVIFDAFRPCCSIVAVYVSIQIRTICFVCFYNLYRTIYGQIRAALPKWVKNVSFLFFKVS